MINQTEILKKLKSNFKQADLEYIDDYHLKDIKSNLYFAPYDGIDERANSIRSSAAMIYNTIGPKEIILDGVKYIKIEYEKKFPVLNQKRRPAQLDVSMLSEDGTEWCLIESKCLEWIEKPKSLKDAYLVSDNYLPETGDNISHFIESFRNLLSCPQKPHPKDNKRILPFYQKYDAIQMNIHILGIYNFCARKERKIPEKIRLLNIVWDYDEAEEYQIEEREGKEYVAYANVTFRNLFKQLGVDFSVEYVRYSDFLKRVDWSKDMEHRNYLRRYEIKKILTESEFFEQFDILWNETKHKYESQEQYENRIKDSTEKLEEDAFDKAKAKLRYNPKFKNEAYTKQELEAMKNEDWKFLSNLYYTKYAVSSLARVAFLDKDGFYHILEQDDEYSKGYLRLDPAGRFNIDHQIEVYKLIAMGFHGKQIGDGYDVHHRINDGYNCRPENLILLTRKQHNRVHSSTK